MDPVFATIPKHLMREPEQVAKAKNTMGKDDFLKLLMTQLQNQDPVNPMNHEQFATQLAQFSQLEQLANIGKGIEGLKGGKVDETKLQALGMIGKEIRASGSRVDLQGGQAVALKFLPDAEATPVKATIYDTSGTLVRELELTGRKDGEAVVWDGMDSQGNTASSGRYNFKVYGVDKNGQSKELGSEISGKVTGVETEGDKAVLIVDTGSGPTKVEMARVSRVSLPSEKAPALAVASAEGEPGKTLPKVIQLGQLEAESEEEDGIESRPHADMSQVFGGFGR